MSSYQEELNKNIEGIINNLLKDISGKYNLNLEELTDMYKKDYTKNQTEESNSESISKEKLSKLKKKELEQICREKGIQNIKGKKEELINRILNNNKDDNKIVENIITGLSTILIEKNKFGNYEHKQTNLIFNRNTKTVIGKQNQDSGEIEQLSESDIELCNQYKFKFKIPDQIDQDDNGTLDIDVTEEEEDEEEEDED